MKRFSIFKWFKNVSIAKKLYFTVGIMATLIAIELAVLIFSINTLSSVRAYVGGEGLWSKAQKDAMYQLLKYGRTHDNADYNRFLDFMKVPMGDHKTLVVLKYLHSSRWKENIDHIHTDKIVFRMNKKDIPDLAASLVNNGALINSLQPKYSLESYFLSLTTANRHVDTFTN